MLKVNDNTLGVIMNFDFFNNVINSNTASDAFYSVGMYASDVSGAILSFYSCATTPCDTATDYSQLIKAVTLTQNAIIEIKIKMVYASGTSEVNVYIDDESTPVYLMFYLFFEYLFSFSVFFFNSLF